MALPYFWIARHTAPPPSGSMAPGVEVNFVEQQYVTNCDRLCLGVEW